MSTTTPATAAPTTAPAEAQPTTTPPGGGVWAWQDGQWARTDIAVPATPQTLAEPAKG